MVRPEAYKPGNYILLQSDPSSFYEVAETQEKVVKIKSVKFGTEEWHDARGEKLRRAVLNDGMADWFWF